MTVYRYHGRNRAGVHVSGTVTPADLGLPLAEWIRRKYRAGWQALTVVRAPAELAQGELAGAIEPAELGLRRHRSWWSE